MQDIRDWSQREKMIPGPDTPMKKMGEIVRKDQAGDIGIWGKVERVAGNETDVYDLWISRRRLLGGIPRGPSTRQGPGRKPSARSPTSTSRRRSTASTGGPIRSPWPRTPSCKSGGRKAPNLVKGDFEKGRGSGRLGSPAPRRDLGR